MKTASELVVLLMGPTGAGKSDVALSLAERYPLEIVSVDSAMVFRGLDIGTAKPARAVRERAPHHLIDILDPAESYSVGQFLRDAAQAMADIRARGRVPLLTGGTMLYFHALLRGLARLPEADAQLRHELDERMAREGSVALHRELARVDAAAAARIHPNDPQRIQRALEVYLLTGRAISVQQAETRALLNDATTLKLALSPRSRTVLHERIEQRFLTMMSHGFLEEVRGLHARPDLSLDKPAMRAVGYRQLWQHLAGDFDLDTAVAKAIAATRRLAKRQFTWLRALPAAEWFDPVEISSMSRIGESLARRLAKSA